MTRGGRGWGRHEIWSGALIAVVAATAIIVNTDLQAPPRFDGARYAILGQALATGRGYREIDHPDQPRDAHFPPGFPAALAALWRITGRSVSAAHLFAVACTVTAVVAAWWWLRALYPPRIALGLGLALALNWTWGRVGGTIQSEPLFLLNSQLAVLTTAWAGRRGGIGPGLLLGCTLAACVLTRHVGACLALAAGLDLLLRRRWAAAVTAGLVAIVLVVPWIVWLATVQHHTQAELLVRSGLAARVTRQALFYLQRLPDQLTGPVVEVGTVFRRSTGITALVNAWAVLASGLILGGWTRALRNPRRRLAALIPLATLALLLVWPFIEAGRFLIPLLPFLLVGAVEGMARLIALGRIRHPRAWAVGVVLVLSLPYTAYALISRRAEAQRRTHRDFDAACAWIAGQASPPGPVLTRDPGEVYWLTGRQALNTASENPEEIARVIDDHGVAYLLIDNERYARAPANPLNLVVETYPDRVRRVWGRETGKASIVVYLIHLDKRRGSSK